MPTYLYFAYGSNMLSQRLRGRTPSARAIGSGQLGGHRLSFDKIGRDGSGKCHVQHTGRAADIVAGVVFEIDRTDKPALDRAESLGHGYAEQWLDIRLASGKSIPANVYVGTHLGDNLQPFCWYKRFVVAGAKQHGLPSDYITQLERTPSITDPDTGRKLANERILQGR